MSGLDFQTLVLYISNLSASTLSLIGAGAIMLNYLFFTSKSQILYKLIFFLSLADFFGSLFIFVSQGLLFGAAFYSISYSHGLCIFFRAGINLFFVASFVWTSCIAIHIWVSSHQKAQIPIIFFHLFAWGVPAIMTVILVAGHFVVIENDYKWCHPTTMAKWFLWEAPLCIAFMCNSVFYFMSIRRFKVDNHINRESSRSTRQKKLQWKIKKRLTLYLLVFLVCWIWDVVNKILEAIGITPPFWLSILQSTFSPLQGFLNFLVYGLSSRMFKGCFSDKHERQLKTPLIGEITYQGVN